MRSNPRRNPRFQRTLLRLGGHRARVDHIPLADSLRIFTVQTIQGEICRSIQDGSQLMRLI